MARPGCTTAPKNSANAGPRRSAPPTWSSSAPTSRTGSPSARLVQRLATGVTAFYDIDTPVTLAALEAGTCEYLTPELLRGFDLYLSFTGGPTLDELEKRLGARAARALYCSADPDIYRPDPARRQTLGPRLSRHLQPGPPAHARRPALRARRRPAAGRASWSPARSTRPSSPGPRNIERIEHLSPGQHRGFFAAQRFTLNVTRADMIRRGYSPSVRLFEAACCGVPIISDWWPGLDSFFRPGEEILIARTADEVLGYLQRHLRKSAAKPSPRPRARGCWPTIPATTARRSWRRYAAAALRGARKRVPA